GRGARAAPPIPAERRRGQLGDREGTTGEVREGGHTASMSRHGPLARMPVENRPSAADRAQPGGARVDCVLRLARGPVVAGLARLGERAFVLLDGLAQLRAHGVGARLRLGVVALPVDVLALLERVLDAAHAAVEVALDVTREDAPDLVPATLDAREHLASLLEVGDVCDLRGLLQQGLTGLDARLGLGLLLGVALGTSAVEHVTGRLEAGPERVVGL